MITPPTMTQNTRPAPTVLPAVLTEIYERLPGPLVPRRVVIAKAYHCSRKHGYYALMHMQCIFQVYIVLFISIFVLTSVGFSG